MQNTVSVVTTAEHQYYGSRKHVGDEYECEENSAPTFINMGWVRPRDAGDGRSQTYMTRDMAAAPKARAHRTK